MPKDNVLAHAWVSLAAISGDEDAVNLRDNEAAKLTPNTQEKAQAYSAKLQKKIYSQLNKE